MWERGRLSCCIILSNQIIHLGRREKWADRLADAGREIAADQMVVSNHSVTITAVEQQIMVTQSQMQNSVFILKLMDKKDHTRGWLNLSELENI